MRVGFGRAFREIENEWNRNAAPDNGSSIFVFKISGANSVPDSDGHVISCDFWTFVKAIARTFPAQTGGSHAFVTFCLGSLFRNCLPFMLLGMEGFP